LKVSSSSFFLVSISASPQKLFAYIKFCKQLFPLDKLSLFSCFQVRFWAFFSDWFTAHTHLSSCVKYLPFLFFSPFAGFSSPPKQSWNCKLSLNFLFCHWMSPAV
jgi:hypothetical protein